MKITSRLGLWMAFMIPMSLWGAYSPVISNPVEWRCVHGRTPDGTQNRLLFQGRTFGDRIYFAWYNSFGEGNNGYVRNIRHNDGDEYALINIVTDYDDQEFWIDIAIWDSDTLQVRLQVPDTEKVCQQ